MNVEITVLAVHVVARKELRKAHVNANLGETASAATTVNAKLLHVAEAKLLIVDVLMAAPAIVETIVLARTANAVRWEPVANANLEETVFAEMTVNALLKPLLAVEELRNAVVLMAASALAETIVLAKTANAVRKQRMLANVNLEEIAFAETIVNARRLLVVEARNPPLDVDALVATIVSV